MTPTSSSAIGVLKPCEYCGNGVYHSGVCPRVKVIEYFEWGGVKRVEFHDDRAELAPPRDSGK